MSRSPSTAVLLAHAPPQRTSDPVAGPPTAAPGSAWGVLLRNSKKRAAKVMAISLSEQERSCRQAVGRFDSDPDSVEIFCDEGRSGGGARRRPQRDALLEAVRAGRIGAVVAYDPKRIGRNLTESCRFWDECAAAGAFVTCVTLPDLSNAAVRGALFGVAEEEWKERQRYALASTAARRRAGLVGVRSGWAYGLRWDREQLVAIERELDVVREVFELVDDGWTYGAVARHLTRKRAPRRHVNHGEWDSAAVSRIVNCTWYAGRVPDGHDSSGTRRFWDAGRTFVDADVLRRVEARAGGIEHPGQRFDHALSGLLYCAACGGWSPMSLAWSRKPRKDGSRLERPRYRCIHRVRDRDACPDGMSIDSHEVEDAMRAVIRAAIGDDELAQLRFARRQDAALQQLSSQVADCDAAITASESEQDRLFARRRNGEVIPDRIYNAEMARLDAQLAGLHARRDEAARRTVLSSAALGRLTAALAADGAGELDRESWFGLAPSRRNEFLRLVFPYGVFIFPRGPERKVGDISGRVGPRTTSDAEAADSRRLAPAGPDKPTQATVGMVEGAS